MPKSVRRGIGGQFLTEDAISTSNRNRVVRLLHTTRASIAGNESGEVAVMGVHHRDHPVGRRVATPAPRDGPRCREELPERTRTPGRPLIRLLARPGATEKPLPKGHRPIRKAFPNDRLAKFLRTCPPHVAGLREYFTGRRRKGEPYTFLPYGERHYLDQNRAAYFEGLSTEWLQNALVFFDPDTGMEPASFYGKAWVPEKYLRYRDLAGAIARMSPDSVALVFQYRYQGEAASSYFPRRARAFTEQVGLRPCWVNTGTIGLYAITKSGDSLEELRRAIGS